MTIEVLTFALCGGVVVCGGGVVRVAGFSGGVGPLSSRPRILRRPNRGVGLAASVVTAGSTASRTLCVD